jgi:transposase
MCRYDLTDFEWSVIARSLPNELPGVPRVDDRRGPNGIVWALRSGGRPRTRLSASLTACLRGYALNDLTFPRAKG